MLKKKHDVEKTERGMVLCVLLKSRYSSVASSGIFSGLVAMSFPLLHFSTANCSLCIAHSNEIDPGLSDVCNTSRFTQQWCHMQKRT